MRFVLLAVLLMACATTTRMAPAPVAEAPASESPTAPGAAPRVVTTACVDHQEWPLWDRYVAHFMSGDGRIVSHTEQEHSTSEGQSYALFFALVNNDHPRFDKVLGWTEANLARGSLTKHLPAWLWGRSSKGQWRVLDTNSAADSDLWIAYDLLEAGRLWGEPRYTRLGEAMLGNIRRQEVAALPGLGPMLLPAPKGFELEKGRAWRLNPSYLPPEVLRRLASADPTGPWQGVLDSAVRLVKESSSHGLVADWVLYRAGRGFEPDPEKGPIGSYDAIRVYLWAGLLSSDDPLRSELVNAISGILRLSTEGGFVPEQVNVSTDEVAGRAPPGFMAALLPLARSSGDGLSAQLEQQLADSLADGLYGQPPAYYDQNLILFAQGFTEGRFRFALDGSLVPRWGEPCTR